MCSRSPFSQRVLKPAWQRAGIARLTFHGLRHTAASLAISAGASPKAVQKMPGHASAAMTLDVYAGLFDQDAEDLGARMSDLADRAAERGEAERSAHHAPTGDVLVADLPAGQLAVNAC
jgi:site-specific recombinase XerC